MMTTPVMVTVVIRVMHMMMVAMIMKYKMMMMMACNIARKKIKGICFKLRCS